MKHLHLFGLALGALTLLPGCEESYTYSHDSGSGGWQRDYDNSDNWNSGGSSGWDQPSPPSYTPPVYTPPAPNPPPAPPANPGNGGGWHGGGGDHNGPGRGDGNGPGRGDHNGGGGWQGGGGNHGGGDHNGPGRGDGNGPGRGDHNGGGGWQGGGGNHGGGDHNGSGRGDGNGPGRGRGGKGPGVQGLMTILEPTKKRQRDAAELLARDYNIRTSSARKILQLAESREKEKFLGALGLRAEEIAPIVKLEMPSNHVVNKIAGKLGEKSSRISRVLSDFLHDVRAQ